MNNRTTQLSKRCDIVGQWPLQKFYMNSNAWLCGVMWSHVPNFHVNLYFYVTIHIISHANIHIRKFTFLELLHHFTYENHMISHVKIHMSQIHMLISHV